MWFRKSLRQILKTCWMYRYVLFVVLVGIYAEVFHYVYLRFDNDFPCGIGMWSEIQGLELYQFFHAHSFLDFVKEYFSAKHYQYYSPFIGLCYCIYYCLFGVHTNMELMINSVFVIVGMLGIYKLGALLFDKRTGVVAAIVWSVLPAVLYNRSTTFFEFPLMCIMPWMVFCLLKSDSFRRLRWSIMFGLVFSLMISIKYDQIIYGVIPVGHLFFSTIAQLRRKSTEIVRQYRNAFIAGIMGAIFVLNGVLLNWKLIVSWYELKQYLGDFYSRGDYLFYINWLSGGSLVPRWLWMVFLAVMAVVVVCLCCGRHKDPIVRSVGYLSVYILIPLIVLSNIQLKTHLYIMVVANFIVLIVVGGLGFLKRVHYVRYVFMVLLIMYGMIGHYVASGLPMAEANVKLCTNKIFRGRWSCYDVWVFPKVRTARWKQGYFAAIDRIMTDYRSDFPEGNQPGSIIAQPRVLGLMDGDPHSPVPLEYYVLRIKAPLKIISLDMHEKLRYDTFEYMIQIENEPYNNYYVQIVKSDIANISSVFWDHYSVLDTIPVDENKSIIIYKRR